MAAKVCPRCGAQYASLKSATCPTCFAKLITVDDETARELAAARAEVEGSEEFQEAKEADDEEFRQQSFGACLGVVGITFVTLIVAVLLIVAAYKRYGHHAPSARPDAPLAKGSPTDPLTELPVTGAKLADVMPAKLGAGDTAQFTRTEMDQDTVLSGTLTPIYHAVYRRGLAALETVDLYAIPTGQPTPEQNAFRTAIALTTQIGGTKPRPMRIFATQHWRYASVGEAGASDRPLGDLSESLKKYFSNL